MSEQTQEHAARVGPVERKEPPAGLRRPWVLAAALGLALASVAGWWVTRGPSPRREREPVLRVGEGFAEAMDRHRELAEAALSRAGTHLRALDAAAAVAEIDAALGLHPDPAPPLLVGAYADRGLARALLGDQQGAGEDLDLALQLDPRSARALRIRALLRVDRGDQGGAAADLEEALRLTPTAPWTDEARAQVVRLRSGAWAGGAREELVAFARSGS